MLPISIVRWIEFVQEENGGQDHVSSGWAFGAAFLHDMFGFVNVLLLLATRPNLLLFEDPEGAGALAPRLRNRVEVKRVVERVDVRERKLRRRERGRAPGSPERTSNGLEPEDEVKADQKSDEELLRLSRGGQPGDVIERRSEVMEMGRLNHSTESF